MSVFRNFLGNVKIVELFLNHHAKVYVRDIDDRTALHEASRWSNKNDEENKNRIDCIRHLLEEDGADVNALTIRRESPLMIACRYGTVDLVKYLMDNGADLLHTDLQGYNCLEVAIDEKNKSVVEHLLDNDHMFELMRNAQIYEEGSSQRTMDRNQEDLPVRCCLAVSKPAAGLRMCGSSKCTADTPMRKLIKNMPEMALKVLDRCITTLGDDRSKLHRIIYDYELLEDQFIIPKWLKG